jgi:hypothetical protein
VVTRPVPADRAARFAADLIKDCISDGWASQWRYRARVFDACRVREGDFLGRCPKETPEERDRRLDAVIEACTNRAAVIELDRAW